MKSILNSNSIKTYAQNIGFSLVGITKAIEDKTSASRLERWFNNNHHASMKWMYNRKEERKSIYKYFPEAKSVIALGLNYYTENKSTKEYGKIASQIKGLSDKLLQELYFIFLFK